NAKPTEIQRNNCIISIRTTRERRTLMIAKYPYNFKCTEKNKDKNNAIHTKEKESNVFPLTVKTFFILYHVGYIPPTYRV
ncbi:MAG: hypothetical protein LBI60_03025, partial [Bacteroidales bacterium]|nr:hypothetical protein [Bacteroidales bacterium]